MQVDVVGDLDTAGFVQVLTGRTSDPERSRELMNRARPPMAALRPDVLGGVIVGHDDGNWTRTNYFTSEARPGGGADAAATRVAGADGRGGRPGRWATAVPRSAGAVPALAGLSASPGATKTDVARLRAVGGWLGRTARCTASWPSVTRTNPRRRNRRAATRRPAAIDVGDGAVEVGVSPFITFLRLVGQRREIGATTSHRAPPRNQARSPSYRHARPASSRRAGDLRTVEPVGLEGDARPARDRDRCGEFVGEDRLTGPQGLISPSQLTGQTGDRSGRMPTAAPAAVITTWPPTRTTQPSRRSSPRRGGRSSGSRRRHPFWRPIRSSFRSRAG